MNHLRNSKTAKVVSGFVGFLTAVTMLGGAALPASAATADELQAQINSLLATIQALQAQLGATTGGGSVGAAACTFISDLTLNSKGADVTCLQNYLKGTGHFTFAGGATGFFGNITKNAVMAWQASNGVTPAAGYFGAISRAKYAQVGGSTAGGPVTPGPTPAGSGLTVSPASQPAASIAPKGASRVPFTRIMLTASNDGDVTVNSITVQRTGFASNSAFAGIVLLNEEGIQLGVAKTLNSNDQAIVGETFVVKRGTTKTYTIAANMNATLTTFVGQLASLSVVGINTSATVNGSLPITGASHTMNQTLTIGTATLLLSSFDPNSATTKSIGDTNVKFSGVRITAGSAEDVRLKSIRFNQSGSAGANDLANVMVYVDGTAYPTVVSTDGKYYTATFGSGVVIAEGLSKDVYIQGDVIGSSVSGRTVQFDIYKNTDIYLTGETFFYGITAVPNGNCNATASTATTASEFLESNTACNGTGTAGTPFLNASLFTINPGTATSIQKANSVIAQNIAVNVPNQVLGGFTTIFTGEPISVQSLPINFNWSSGEAGSELITNITIVDENGTVVAGPEDGVEAAGGTNQTVTFTDTIIFPVGSHTFTIKGKIPTTIANNATVTGSTTPSSWSNITGQTSGNSIALSNGTVTMNTMTIKTASLAISLSTTPASQSVVAGGNSLLLANVQVDASQSGEDMRISQVKLRESGSGTNSNLASCQIYNGSTVLTTGSNVPTSIVATANTFTLDSALTIPKGTVVTLSLKCNLAGGATGTYEFDINASDTITATGLVSGTSLTITPTAASGGTMTVAAGTLAVTLDSSSPSYKTATNGSINVPVSVLRFTATNEAVNLNKITLQLSPTTVTASSTPSDVVQVTLWDGATQVGTAVFTGALRYATSTLSSIVNVPKDGFKLITVKADLPSLNAQAGVGTNPKPGAHVKIDYDGSDSTGTQGTGADSGTTLSSSSGDTASAGIRVYRSYPIFTYSTSAAVAQNGVNDLLVLNVQAGAEGDVQLQRLVFSVSTTTANISAPTFTGPNGNVGTVAGTCTTTNPNPCTITVVFDSGSNTADKVISAGSSNSYTLKATLSLTGTNTTGAVSVNLEGDTAHPSIATLLSTTSDLVAGGISTQNIVWSPNSTTTSATTNNDWTNGFGLGGCFATAGLGQDCAARVIAK